MNQLRPELTLLPTRMRDLPIDERGYPVPWFVLWLDGKPEFRAMDLEKWRRAIRERRCWVCGQTLGRYLCFVVGPMCAINRTTTEPPSHLECAQWSARNCPFLARPHMARRPAEELNGNLGGIAIKRNPGVWLLWVTESFEVWQPKAGERLIRIGPMLEYEWWAEGRRAKRAEVVESIRTGLPLLEEIAATETGGLEALAVEAQRVAAMYPEVEA